MVMKPTRDYIKDKFNYFNYLIFQNRLPEIPIEISDVKSYVGLCVFKRKKTLSGKWKYFDFRLRFNTRIDLPEKDIEDTIIHEMIHYYIGFNQITDTSPHGKIFKTMMEEINKKFNRQISIRHRSTQSQKEDLIDSKSRWHVIALLIPASKSHGNIFIKVLPRVIPKIIHYCSVFEKDERVARIELYLSNNPFFNRFPNSASLKAHLWEEMELRNNLQNAHPLEIQGGKVLEIRRKK